MLTAHIYPINRDADVKTIHLRATPGCVAAALWRYLVRPNMRWLKHHPEAPLFLDAGFEYGGDPNEDWNTAPWMYRAIDRNGFVDCEDVASLGAAEDRERRGIASIPCVYRASTLGMHCIVGRPRKAHRTMRSARDWDPWVIGEGPNYVFIDLCRAIGMGKNRCF